MNLGPDYYDQLDKLEQREVLQAEDLLFHQREEGYLTRKLLKRMERITCSQANLLSHHAPTG